MASESEFVELAKQMLEKVLPALGKELSVDRKAPLLYELAVDNRLKIMDAERILNPQKGGRGYGGAFETDLCVFENVEGVKLPRVVLEFKTKITTHDVLVYSAKAFKHKQIYPYLRYGIVASDEGTVPGRLFTHNEALDFCAAMKGAHHPSKLESFLKQLVEEEIENSRTLERITFEKCNGNLFRTKVIVESL